MNASVSKVHIFWEGHKILRNLHQLFDWQYIGQIIGGDFAKFCGLLRIYLHRNLKLIVFFFHSYHLPEKLGTKLLGPCHLANQDLVLSKSETTITKLIGNLTDSCPTWLISNSRGKPLLVQLQFTQISGETLILL